MQGHALQSTGARSDTAWQDACERLCGPPLAAHSRSAFAYTQKQYVARLIHLLVLRPAFVHVLPFPTSGGLQNARSVTHFDSVTALAAFPDQGLHGSFDILINNIKTTLMLDW